MAGTVILSHGYGSGPDAVKTTAMARVAERLGWRAWRPDYSAHDALGMDAAAAPRLQQLLALAQEAEGPLLLAGSSMGAFISGLASLRCACAGLFLLATPVAMAGKALPFDFRSGIPTVLVHGFADEVCAPDAAIALARRRGLPLLMVPDDHRLGAHVDWIGAQFELFLRGLGGAA